ncbi:DUF624 domain-containing protein [Aliirhizobium smilacinae]|uniref:DUF624 domain-containing protein n=1 Tax=Aliirhizobium smilacinae TaxID=1395944 RepID=A0A5C4XJW7_9HYPH|nr:DUF624 domain-containing protein [Rhizobium smilacinae]TNM63835.1 DUF624 domain-containing protein [Rhizobium smilacinae]
MQWLRNMWTKEGPGIPKNAPKKTGLALFGQIFAREWWEMVKLNILFILAALFIIPLPAALAASAFVCVALVEDRNTYLLQDFLDAMRRYFWRATLWGLFFAGAIGLGVYAIGTYASATRDNLAMAAPLAIALVVTGFLCVMACHLLVLMVMRDLSTANLLRLSAMASIIRPLPVIAALLFVAGLWLAHIAFYPVSVFMPATLNFSLGMFAIVFAAHRAAMMVLALPVAVPPALETGTADAKHI